MYIVSDAGFDVIIPETDFNLRKEKKTKIAERNLQRLGNL